MVIDYSERISNNVDLAGNATLQRWSRMIDDAGFDFRLCLPAGYEYVRLA